MADLEQGLSQAIEDSRHASLVAFANSQTGNISATEAEMPQPKAKPTTWRQRIHKVGEEMLADPSASRAERFLAGMHIGVDQAIAQVGQPVLPEEGGRTDIVGRVGSYVLFPFSAGWQAFTTGLKAAGVPEEIIKAGNDAMISVMATTPIRGMRPRERSILDNSGVKIEEPKAPSSTIQADLARQRAEFAAGKVPAQVDELARVISGGDRPTQAHRAQAAEVIAANPQADMNTLVREALKPTADRIAPVAEPGAAPGAPTIAPKEPTATPQPVPGEPAKPTAAGTQPKPIPGITTGENIYVLHEMEQSAKMAAGEPVSGKRIGVPAGEEVVSEETSGGMRWIGSKTLKPDWMKIEGKNEYYKSSDVLTVIEKLKQGEWPKTALQARIADQIAWALKHDAEQEKGRAEGAGIAAVSPAQLNEEQIRKGFFADVDRLAAEEATATQVAPPVAEPTVATAPPQPEPIPSAPAAPTVQVSPTAPDWVKTATAAGQEIPPPPERPYPPGFKYVPGGPEGPMATAIHSLLEGEREQTTLAEQKRATRGHDVTQAAADALRKAKKVTLGQILEWTPGTIKNAEEARAAVDIAEAAVTTAETLSQAALRGEYDTGAALSAGEVAKQALINASAVYSEIGRALESAKMTGKPASPAAVAELMGLPPISGGLDLVNERIAAIESTAGGAKMALEQMAGLSTRIQREQLGTLRQRLGRSGMELFFTSLFGLKTSVKVAVSGPITAGYEIAVSGVAEMGRRLLNAVAPDKVDAVAGVTRGETWARFQGALLGIHDAWAGIVNTWQASARVAKAEGVIKAEQQWVNTLREQNPEWSNAVRRWRLNPQTTGENFPEFPELVQHGLDVLGSVARYTTDALSAAHSFSYTIQDRMGAAAKAHEIATRQGLTGDAFRNEVRRLVNERPPEVDRAAMQTAKKNTFIQELSPSLQNLSASSSNAMMKLTVAPVTRVPLGILEFSLEGVPVVQNLMRGWRRDFMAGGAPRDMALAKMAVGWTGLLTLANLAANGYLTGSPPRNKPERDAAEAAGVQWNSVKLPGMDTWTSYRAMEPVASWLGIAADMMHIARDIPEAQLPDYVIPLFIAAGEDFLNKPIMQGISRWVDVFSSEDPNHAIETSLRQLQPPLPFQSTLMAVEPYFDDVRREARGWTDHYLRLLPGNDLPPRRNIITGEPLHYEGAWGPDFLSPFATHTESDSATLKELVRLRGAGITAVPDHISGARPPQFVEAQAPGKVPGVPLSPEQRDRWIVLMTQKPYGGKTLEGAMGDLIQSPAYAQQSDVTKATMLQGIYNRYRLAGQHDLLGEDKELAVAAQAAGIERKIQRLPTAQQAPARERMAILGLGR